MEDTKRIFELEHALIRGGRRIEKGVSFGKFAGIAEYEKLSKDWELSLKQQEWDAKVAEYG